MTELTVIPPKTTDKPAGGSVRVAAYCRVSTNETDQRNSLRAQTQFFEKRFAENTDWIKVGIFSDEGISGTSMGKRAGFNKMIESALGGNIDLIITKEVSRFSRSIRDTMDIAKILKNHSVYILFLTDGLNTSDICYEDKLLALSYQAENESRRISNRVRWGQSEAMKSGVIFGRSRMFGYEIKRDDAGIQKFTVIPNEAETVKRIFTDFASGLGTYTISRSLRNDCIPCGNYSHGWSSSVILRILKNEKYVGDLIQGKTYTNDVMTHKKKQNNDRQSSLYIIKDHHAESAIVSRELWESVQSRLGEIGKNSSPRAIYANRRALSGKIICGICGSRYIPYTKRTSDGLYTAWICENKHLHGNDACTAKRVNDKVLRELISDILRSMTDECGDIISRDVNTLLKNRHNMTYQKRVYENNIENAKEKLTSLTHKLLDGTVSDEAYKLAEQKYLNEINICQSKLGSLQDSLDTIKQTDTESVIGILGNTDVFDSLTECIVQKIDIYQDNVIGVKFVFFDESLLFRYETYGRLCNYHAKFDHIGRKTNNN